MRSTPLIALAAAAATAFALVAAPGLAAEASPTVDRCRRRRCGDREGHTRQRHRAPRCVSPPSTSAPPAPTGAPPATGCSGRFQSPGRSRAAIPGSSRSRNSGPGRADGKKAKIGNALRQTESLEKALRSVGASQYKLARSTSYVAPGTSHGTQGARILYDKNKYRLISKCRETTGKKNYNSSCSMDLPVKGRRCEVPPPERGVRRVRGSPHRQELLRHLGPPRRSAQRQPRQGEGPRRPACRADPRRLQPGQEPRRQQADPLRWRHQLLAHQAWQPRAVQRLDEPGFRDSTGAPSRIDAGTRRSTTGSGPSRRTPRVARSLSTSSWRRAPRASERTRT